MDKKNVVSVIGIGRVGLPLCLILSEAQFKVFGIDVRADYIKTISEGKMPFVEEGAQELLGRNLGKNFFPTTDLSKVSGSNFVILTLGTPVDEHLNPDYKQIDSVMASIAKYLQNGQVIILRSTVAPGTTEYLKGTIEKNTGFKIGKTLFLAFCPERIAQGKSIEETKQIPQIIGGVDNESTKEALKFFKKFTAEQLETDSRSAELAKIFTNMYRYINFSISNEFMILAQEHEREIYDILHLINYNYKRGGVKSPGYAAGPCLYKDGFFLINSVPFNELISVSWKINETTPLYLIKTIKQQVGLKNKKVALLGMTFKADNDDTRQSLSFKIKKALEREQAIVACHDPLVAKFSMATFEDTIKNADAIIVGVNHSAYKKIPFDRIKKLAKADCIVCDIWNTFGKNRVVYKTSEALP